jgi:hypothetical protein
MSTSCVIKNGKFFLPTANANLARLDIPCVGETFLCFYTGSDMRPLCAGLFEGCTKPNHSPKYSSLRDNVLYVRRDKPA